MAAGPILIFDKSLLEALSPDEAVWLAQFYRVNMTPLFFVETLADLEKEVDGGRTPEHVVGRLAEKTSVMGVDANVHHSRLCAGDLMGYRVEMRNYVVRGGGRSVQKGEQKGVIFDESEESNQKHSGAGGPVSSWMLNANTQGRGERLWRTSTSKRHQSSSSRWSRAKRGQRTLRTSSASPME